MSRLKKSAYRAVLLTLVTGLLSFVSAPPSQAAFSIGSTTSSPVSNTGGGGLASVNCASNGILSGVTSSINAGFDGVTLTYTYGTCATLNSDGVSISSVSTKSLGPYGGSGTSENSDSCSGAGGTSVIVGARLYKTPSGYAAGVQLLCGSLPAGGNRAYSSTILGTSTGTYQDIACNTNNVARGLYVYYGGILDRFGINCAPIQSAGQTITFNSIGTQSKTWSITDVSPTSSSGLTVSLASNTTSICTVSGFRISFVAGGTCSITASQSGNTTFAAASTITRTFEILPGSPSATTSNYDQDGSGTGAVADVSTSGGESVIVTGNHFGTCTEIVAAGGGWTGSIALTGVTSTSFTFVVPASSSFYGWIRLSCSGINFDLSAFIYRTAVPTNSVVPVISGNLRPGQVVSATNGTWSNTPTSYSYQWSRASTSGGTYASIAGATTSTYTIVDGDLGWYLKITVTATNKGGSASANSLASSQVALIAQSITFSSLGTSSKTYPYSQQLTMTTSGTSGSGAVTFAIFAGGTATSCSLSDSGSSATITATTSGTCLIKATIAADATYDSATSSALTFTFNKASQSALSITSTTGSYGTPLTLTASGGSGTGALSYSYSAGTSTCSLSSSTLTANAPGTCLVTATKALDDAYSAASSSQTTITFAYGSTSSTVTIAAGTLYYRQAKSISAVASVAGKLTFRANNVVISGCKNLIATAGNSYTRTCTYRPSTKGYVVLSVTLVPTDSSYLTTTNRSERLFVNPRTGTR
jgi:hypothetical protein